MHKHEGRERMKITLSAKRNNTASTTTLHLGCINVHAQQWKFSTENLHYSSFNTAPKGFNFQTLTLTHTTVLNLLHKRR